VPLEAEALEPLGQHDEGLVRHGQDRVVFAG